jgi:hypothetical protein
MLGQGRVLVIFGSGSCCRGGECRYNAKSFNRVGISIVSTAPSERYLAAIVAADVVGYSRLMGADERGTLAALKAHRRDLIDPLIAAHARKTRAQHGRHDTPVEAVPQPAHRNLESEAAQHVGPKLKRRRGLSR